MYVNSSNIYSMKLINWERKGNFNGYLCMCAVVVLFVLVLGLKWS